MDNTYTLHVAGLTRELTICKVNDHLDIAAFIIMGYAELTVDTSAELLKKCPDFDILLTAEAKGHFLVIPKRHSASAAALTEGDAALLGHIFAVIAQLAQQTGLENGYRVVSNVGPDAGQTVPHLHFHVLGGEVLPV